MVVMAFTILLASVAPAFATSGGDDLESVRADVAGTFTYKMGLLDQRRAQSDNPERVAVYAAGIAELASVRDNQVAAATTVEQLWALDDLAHTIYHETVAAAEAVPPTPGEELAAAKDAAWGTIGAKITKLRKWIEGCDDPEAIATVNAGIAELEALYPLVDAALTADEAYAVKQRAHDIYGRTIDAAEAAKAEETKPEPDPEKTEAQRAAEALERARRATLALIADKVSILRTAADAEQIPAIVNVFAAAASDIESLTDDAEAASTKTELARIDERVLSIYEAAKEAAMAIRNSDDGDPTEALADYLARVVNYVTTTTENAAPTADRSPDTYDELVRARDRVLERVDRVAAVIETGDRLDERWEDLNDSLSDYRLALIRHYIALGEPMTIGGIQIPG